jgi:acrylyl-CoA reductase (NADPH)
MSRALFLDERGGVPQLRDADEESLAEGEVRVAVSHSGLNYKDALAITGEGKIVRGAFPFVPGIDLAGEVVESHADAFAEGDRVIGTGWGLGETRPGGYAERQRVPASALVQMPEALDARRAMVAGTAGFTATLAVMALEEHDFYGDASLADAGEIVVTGASGAAGSFAVALLAEAGAEVVAATGSEGAHDYLRNLGAARIIGRETLSGGPDRPMQSARWAGAVDAVGAGTLATLISEMERHAAIASFGNAGGHELRATVFPFILRGVSLLGIDSNECPGARRRAAWERLAGFLPSDRMTDRMTDRVVELNGVEAASRDVLAGRPQGRVLVDVGG